MYAQFSNDGETLAVVSTCPYLPQVTAARFITFNHKTSVPTDSPAEGQQETLFQKEAIDSEGFPVITSFF